MARHNKDCHATRKNLVFQIPVLSKAERGPRARNLVRVRRMDQLEVAYDYFVLDGGVVSFTPSATGRANAKHRAVAAMPSICRTRKLRNRAILSAAVFYRSW